MAASIAHDAILENRAVGVTTSGHRLVSLPADRGPRQRQKIMQLLAAVEGDGRSSLAEVLLAGVPQLRRGMTAVVITASSDWHWVRALSGLRGRGVAAVVIALDAESYELATGRGSVASRQASDQEVGQGQRALRFSLAESDLKTYVVSAGDDLGTVLA